MRWRINVKHQDGTMSIVTVYQGQLGTALKADVGDWFPDLEELVIAAAEMDDQRPFGRAEGMSAAQTRAWARLSNAVEKVRSRS